MPRCMAARVSPIANSCQFHGCASLSHAEDADEKEEGADYLENKGRKSAVFARGRVNRSAQLRPRVASGDAAESQGGLALVPPELFHLFGA